MNEKMNPSEVYGDIINLPHHQAEDRNHMSLYDRAAQFAPFAALVGYDEMVKEEARLTDKELTLSEDERFVLDNKLDFISDLIENKEHPEITVIYFEPDSFKKGGSYKKYSGVVKKIDSAEEQIVFYAENGILNGQTIPIMRVKEIHGDQVNFIDENII